MKSPLLVSLLLVHFYLDAESQKKDTAATVKKKQRVLAKKAEIKKPVLLTTDNLKTTLSQETVLVMVTADWCPYCVKMEPLFQESSASHSDTVHATLSFGDHFGDAQSLVKQLETEYGIEQIKTIPTFLLFKKGKLLKQTQGSHTKEQLQALLKK